MTEIPHEGLVDCRLGKIMYERRLSVTQLSGLANLSRPTVRKLRDNSFDLVSKTTIAKLCDVLNLGVGVLFVHNSKPVIETERNQALMGAGESNGEPADM
ncbi:hypothetical protein LCGC14_1822960 [marine sediment metagenome]|uniref:HTH cro/C1-type domain-containing protein n=1 Tax=marine sediment metagenome TaxID=412755 RepID=A0A0F9JHU7_9ZZZZ